MTNGEDAHEPTITDPPPAAGDTTVPVGPDSTDTVPPPEQSTATTPPPAARGGDRAQRASDWQPGQVVAGLYRVKRVLGQGGMGRVYQVRHMGWQVDLAVKTILPTRARDAHLRERFLREAETWVGLGMHPAIAQCYYVREISGQPHIFVEWVGGGSLKDWITRGQVGPGHWPSICDLAIQACDGLAHAHEHGVVHRDVKPANFLVTPQGELKVTDFGLAKTVSLEDETPGPAPTTPRGPDAEGTDESLTLPGQVMGTPSYGAPEQWEEAHTVDGRADIYSLGVVLFELCSGRRPFDNPSGGRPMRIELVRRHLQDPPPDLVSLRSDTPPGLAALVARCLRKDPAERFQTMVQVRQALCAVYAEQTGHEHPRANMGRVAMPAGSLNNRGVSEFDLARDRDALASWREALALEPDHPEATYNEAMLAWDLGETDDLEAVRRVGALLDGPHGNRAALLLGLVHLQRADAEAACRALQLAAKQDDPEAWLALGRAQLALGSWEAAEITIGIALDQEHDTVRARELGAQARERRGPPRGLLCVPPRASGPRPARPPKCIRSQEEAGAANAVLLLPGWRGVSASSSGELTLWDLTCGKRLRVLRGHEGAVHALACAEDGTLISAGADRTVRTWDTDQDGPRSSFETAGAATCLALQRGGPLLAVGGRDKRARVFRWAEAKPIAEFPSGQEGVHALAWLPDGRLLVASDRLRICSAEDVVVLPQTHEQGVFSVWTDGSRCLSGGGDGTIVEWDLERRAPLRTLDGHCGAVLALTADAHGRLLSSSRDQTLRAWDLSSGVCTWTSPALGAPLTCLSSSEDGSLVISGGHDRRLRTWSFERSRRSWQPALARPRSVGDEVERQQDMADRLARAEAALSRRDAPAARSALMDARALHGGARDPRVRELASRLGALLPPTALLGRWQLPSLPAHRRAVRCLISLPQERALSGGEDALLHLWSLGSPTPLTRLEGHGGPLTCLAADGHGLSGSQDRTVRFWDLEAGTCLHTRNLGSEVVAVSIGHGQAAALSTKGVLRRWSFPDAEEQADLQVGDRVTVGAFGHGGRLCLVAEFDHSASLRLIDARSGQDLQELALANPDPLTCLRFDPRGRMALGCDALGNLRAWDLIGGKVLLDVTLPGTEFDVTPDGRFLLVGGGDTPVVFDLHTERTLDTLEGQRPVCVAAHGRYALVGSGGDVLVWELEWALAEAPGSPLLQRLGVRGSEAAVASRYGLDLATSGTRRVERRTRGVGVARHEGPAPLPSNATVEASRWYLLRTTYLWPLVFLLLLGCCVILALVAD